MGPIVIDKLSTQVEDVFEMIKLNSDEHGKHGIYLFYAILLANSPNGSLQTTGSEAGPGSLFPMSF